MSDIASNGELVPVLIGLHLWATCSNRSVTFALVFSVIETGTTSCCVFAVLLGVIVNKISVKVDLPHKITNYRCVSS